MTPNGYGSGGGGENPNEKSQLGVPSPPELLDLETPVQVPLREVVKKIAQEAGFSAARMVVDEHVRNCAIREVQETQKTQGRQIDGLRLTRAKLYGFIAATAFGSGGSAVAIMKLFS